MELSRVRRDNIKWDAPEAERSMGRCFHLSLKGSDFSYSHVFRAFLWHWDILAAARVRVTKTGQSGEYTGFGKDKHLQWLGKGSGIQ